MTPVGAPAPLRVRVAAIKCERGAGTLALFYCGPLAPKNTFRWTQPKSTLYFLPVNAFSAYSHRLVDRRGGITRRRAGGPQG